MSVAILLTALSVIQLADPLDEPEYYCIDVSGWGANLKPDDPVQAHTCKGANGTDQEFTYDGERIVFADSGRCLEIASTRTPLPGAALIIRKCSDSEMQKFVFAVDGQITVANTGLCIAVGEQSAEAFGPSHLWRVLSLKDCDEVAQDLSRWKQLDKH